MWLKMLMMVSHACISSTTPFTLHHLPSPKTLKLLPLKNPPTHSAVLDASSSLFSRTAAWTWNAWTSVARYEGWTARPRCFCAPGCGTARFSRCAPLSTLLWKPVVSSQATDHFLLPLLTLSPNRNILKWTTWIFWSELPLTSLPPLTISISSC